MIQPTPSLGFVEALNASTSKIFDFNGRSRRSEFWWTKLMVFLVSLVLTPAIGGLLDLLTIPLTIRRLHDTGRSGWWWGIGIILLFVFVALFIGDFIFGVLRLVGNAEAGLPFVVSLILKYGLYYLILLIYQLVILVFCCMDSDPYENAYGPSPKYIQPEEY